MELIERSELSDLIVTEKARRPASADDKCFYCRVGIGGYHKKSCVLVCKSILVRAIFEYPVTVPADWNEDMITFHRNYGTWCASNAIDELQKEMKKTQSECLCGIARFEYIKTLSEPFLEE